jgi:hypothetical protein
MPKNPNFKDTIIDKLCCNDLEILFQYIGHTTNFPKRKALHKHNCNNMNSKLYNLKIYQIIRDNGGWDNWSMIMIENFPCNNNLEASMRERYWYEELNGNMNTRKPYRSKEEEKEYIKEYRENNKEYQKEYQKEYRLKRKIPTC